MSHITAENSTYTLRPMTDGEIRYWYDVELFEAFAPQERKPLPDILALRDAGRYELLGLFNADAKPMLGYATIWKAPDINLLLLDYLGVSAKLRDQGLGGKILMLLKEHYADKPLVAESEAPVPESSAEENDVRRRRIAFYERNGFTHAYEMATCGMRWQAMLSAENAAGRLADIMAQHKALYGPGRTDVKVPLGPEETPQMQYWMTSH